MCSYQQILCNEISVKMSLEKELRNLKRQRATGIDSLRPGLLKYCSIDTDDLEKCQSFASFQIWRKRRTW